MKIKKIKKQDKKGLDMEIITWVLGVLLGIFMYNLVSAVSNLIFGLIMGYSYSNISFLGMMLVNENGKMKFRQSDLSFLPSVLLQVKVVPKWKKILMEIWPIIVGGAAAVGLKYWAKFFEEKYRLTLEKTSIILICFLIFHFIMLVNLIFNMFGKSKSAMFWREKDRVMTLLNSGIRPKDIEFKAEELGFPIFGSNIMHHTYDILVYYNALEKGDEAKIKEIIANMEKCLGDMDDNTKIPMYYELVYYYSAIEHNIHKAEGYSNSLLGLFEKDGDVNGKRVYAAYLYYTNKPREKALQVAKEGLWVADKYSIKGIARMEKNILSDLIEKIEGDIYERNIY